MCRLTNNEKSKHQIMTDYDDITERVKSLEQRCTRLGAWCMISSALLITGCLTAALAPGDKVVQAREFVLIDEHGRARGGLSFAGEDAALVLASPDGRDGVALGVGVVTFEPTVVRFGSAQRDARLDWDTPVEFANKQSTLPGEDGSVERVTGLVAWSSGTDRTAIMLEQGKGSSAMLNASDGTAGLYVEGGEKHFGVSQLVAGSEGSALSVSFNDDSAVQLLALPDAAKLGLATERDEHSDGFYGAEVSVSDEGGALHLRNGEGASTFDAP